MTDTTEPKPVRRFAFDTKSMYETEHGKYMLYTDCAETVQQLQDKVSQLKDALEWEEIAHHAERNKARAEENENTSLREQVQQLQRDLEIQKQRVVDLGVLCLESVPRESLENQRQLYDMAVKGRSDMRSALRNERDKVQQLQQRNERLLAALKDSRDFINQSERLAHPELSRMSYCFGAKLDAIIAAEGRKKV